eukprot:428430_1
MSQTTEYYMCTSGDFEPNATLITNTLATNTYEMKIELLVYQLDNLLRIETIRVFDDDINYYDIDTFCLPPEFHSTTVRGTSLNRLECCYWSQRYSYNNYAMSNTLTISYAQFRSNILQYQNQGNEGAIKPPMITEVGITTLDIDGAQSSSIYSLTLQWDIEKYVFSLQPNAQNKTFTKTFSNSSSFCEFSNRFSLEMTANDSNDSLGINSIIVKDESGHNYNINVFCASDQIEEWERYNNSGKKCDNELSEYTMFNGFIYNHTTTIHFIWDKTLFLNSDKKQQGLILYDDYLPQYSCTSNDVTTVTPRSFTLFKDNMNDPLSTGWIFEGTYRESLNAVNCPGGGADKCPRLAGHEASTTTDSSIHITIDTSNYDNLLDISIQYDLALSTMPSGKSCIIYYAFNGGSFTTGKTHTSSGTALQTFMNQTFTIPDHSDLEFDSITIKFVNNALYDNEYCYIDDVYVFVGDTALEIDYCEAFDSSWTYYNAHIYTGSACHRKSCVYLDTNEWATKTYDISRYNNLMLRVDFKIYYASAIRVYYFYDNEPESSLGSIYGTNWNSYSNRQFSIPDSEICGANTLSIRFRCIGSYSSYDCIVDNIVLLGNILNTASPTASPTEFTSSPTASPTELTADPTETPTKIPTVQTINPTIYPTHNPTYIPTTTPTTFPTKYPTSIPTDIPSFAPTQYQTKIPTTVPTMLPTKYPTSIPTQHPTTQYPTQYPTTYPTYQTLIPTIFPSYIPTLNPSINPSYFPTTNPTNYPSKSPTYDPTTTYPTKYPTMHPTVYPIATLYPTTNPSKYPTITSVLESTLYKPLVINGEPNVETHGEAIVIILSLILILVLIFICLVVLIFIYKKKKENAENTMRSAVLTQLQMVRMNNQTNNMDEQKQLLKEVNHLTQKFDEEMENLNVKIEQYMDIQPFMEEKEIEENEYDATWRYKKMNKWTNNEILDWIQNMQLEESLNYKILAKINESQCTGEDIQSLKSVEDVGNAFNITDNAVLCQLIITKIKTFKPVIKRRKIGNNVFKINISSHQKLLVLRQNVTHNQTVRYIKQIYRDQLSVTTPIEDIHFYYKKKLLSPEKTLKQVGIVNDQHLITVKFSADGGNKDATI